MLSDRMVDGLTTELVAREHDAYRRLFAALNAEVPHRQGLSGDELAAVRANRLAVLTNEKGQPTVDVPVATPLTSHEWISLDFFAEQYPSVAPDALFHLCSNGELLEQVNTGPLIEWLDSLVARNHLLVVDFPEYAGPHSTQRRGQLPAAVVDLLEEAGLSAIDVATIGVQHYFEGTAVLRDRSKIRDGNVELADVYRRGLAAGEFAALAERGVAMLDVVDGRVLDEAWRLYETYIGSLNYLTPIVEGLDLAAFEREMKDPQVNKFVSIQGGELKCMMFLSSDISRYSWLSPSYLLRHHFQDVERGSLFEFPCLFTTADARGLSHTNAVFRLACQVFQAAGIDAKITFDCPAQTQRSVSTVVGEIVNRGAVATIEPVETCQQHYMAFKVTKRHPAKITRDASDASVWDRFDPEIYVADNYLTISPEDRVIVEHLVDFYAGLDNVNSDGEPLNIVEVGGGPNLYPILASLPKAGRVTVVEFGAKNVEYLSAQLRGLAPNWKLFWQELMYQDPAYGSIDVRMALRTKIRIQQQSLFDYVPIRSEGCDIVSSHFCVESITSTLGGFQRGLLALAAMTRPGGRLIASFLKGSEGYSVGDDQFPAFPLYEDDLLESLHLAGYCDVSLAVVDNSGALPNDHEWLGMFVVDAVAGGATS